MKRLHYWILLLSEIPPASPPDSTHQTAEGDGNMENWPSWRILIGETWAIRPIGPVDHCCGENKIATIQSVGYPGLPISWKCDVQK